MWPRVAAATLGASAAAAFLLAVLRASNTRHARARHRAYHTILVCSDACSAQAVLSWWLAAIKVGRALPMVGLDVEWVRGSSPAALLQMSIAHVHGRAVRFTTLCVRLCHLDSVPLALKLLIGDVRIQKAGVAVDEDVRRKGKVASQR